MFQNLPNPSDVKLFEKFRKELPHFPSIFPSIPHSSSKLKPGILVYGRQGQSDDTPNASEH